MAEAVVAINNILEPLGFDHQGEFYPVWFPTDDYKFIEIGKCAIALSEGYAAFLDYSIMEYWEIYQKNTELLAMTIKQISDAMDCGYERALQSEV